MLNLSPEKLLLLLVVALVVLGPNRLPQAARSLGRLVAGLRRMSAGVQSEVRDALAEPRDALQGAVGDLGLDSVRKSLTEVVNPLSEVMKPSAPASSGSTSPPGAAPVEAVATPLPPPPDDPSLN